jgi:hypothetical protein
MIEGEKIPQYIEISAKQRTNELRIIQMCNTIERGEIGCAQGWIQIENGNQQKKITLNRQQ